MVPNETCRLCNQTLPLNKFGYHLKSHKIRQAEYYFKFYPKTELLTGEPMIFRDREGYFLHDFDSRRNLITWLTIDSDPKRAKYAKELLARHKKIRNLRFAPSQVELRSSILPARNYYEKEFGSYFNVCNDIGLDSRFEEATDIAIPDTSRLCVWRDTREQTPFGFPNQKVVKLDFGDYTASGEHYCGLFIERKSLVDFVGTLSQHYDRFGAEIKRAKECDSYIVVVVEERLENALRFNLKHSKSTPVFIFHRVKLLMQEFDNVQFVFGGESVYSAELALKILALGEKAKSIDLQYHHEKGQLCGTKEPVRK